MLLPLFSNIFLQVLFFLKTKINRISYRFKHVYIKNVWSHLSALLNLVKFGSEIYIYYTLFLLFLIFFLFFFVLSFF